MPRTKLTENTLRAKESHIRTLLHLDKNGKWLDLWPVERHIPKARAKSRENYWQDRFGFGRPFLLNTARSGGTRFRFVDIYVLCDLRFAVWKNGIIDKKASLKEKGCVFYVGLSADGEERLQGHIAGALAGLPIKETDTSWDTFVRRVLDSKPFIKLYELRRLPKWVTLGTDGRLTWKNSETDPRLGKRSSRKGGMAAGFRHAQDDALGRVSELRECGRRAKLEGIPQFKSWARLRKRAEG